MNSCNTSGVRFGPPSSSLWSAVQCWVSLCLGFLGPKRSDPSLDHTDLAISSSLQLRARTPAPLPHALGQLWLSFSAKRILRRWFEAWARPERRFVPRTPTTGPGDQCNGQPEEFTDCLCCLSIGEKSIGPLPSSQFRIGFQHCFSLV